MLFFLFFKLIPDFFVKEDEDGKIRHVCIKIHVAIAITATTTLLNLNLNYEKLRHKDSKFYLLTNIYYTNFCIFKYQYLFSMVIKGNFCLQISDISGYFQNPA